MRPPKEVRKSIETEANKRQNTTEVVIADSSVTQVPNQQIRINQESRAKIKVKNSGINAGIISYNIRNQEQDESISDSNVKIIDAIKKDNQNDIKASENKSSDVAVTPEQIEKKAKNSIVPKKKNKDDIENYRKKIQRTCNHQYDSTGLCSLCSKNKNSHVFDP